MTPAPTAIGSAPPARKPRGEVAGGLHPRLEPRALVEHDRLRGRDRGIAQHGERALAGGDHRCRIGDDLAGPRMAERGEHLRQARDRVRIDDDRSRDGRALHRALEDSAHTRPRGSAAARRAPARSTRRAAGRCRSPLCRRGASRARPPRAPAPSRPRARRRRLSARRTRRAGRRRPASSRARRRR